MHDEAGFLAAIRQTPADDTARLVFADWLDEQDDPACQPKAEFIRLELRMAETPADTCDRTESLAHLQTLAASVPPLWLAIVSHAKLEGCTHWRTSTTCPGRWELLAPTSFDDMRRCGQCKKVARFCSTLSHARPWTQTSHCVAISPAIKRQPGDLGAPIPPRPRRISLTLEMIERLRTRNETYSRVLNPPPPPPVPVEPEPELPLWGPGIRTPRQPRRQKNRTRHRNIQREDWERAE